MSASDDLSPLIQRLGVHVDPGALRHALTHRSYAFENGNCPHNERLEFLGDSVLGVIVTDALYHSHPDEPESRLAKYRAAVVNSRTLAEVARELGVGEHLLLGRGEQTTGGRDKGSILADALEAIIGAVYLAEGMGAADKLVHSLLDDRMVAAASLGAGLDWKTSLQELGARSGLGSPVYEVLASGPDHAKQFSAVVRVGDQVTGTGTGASKKHAEQTAAAQAYQALVELTSGVTPGIA